MIIKLIIWFWKSWLIWLQVKTASYCNSLVHIQGQEARNAHFYLKTTFELIRPENVRLCGWYCSKLVVLVYFCWNFLQCGSVSTVMRKERKVEFLADTFEFSIFVYAPQLFVNALCICVRLPQHLSTYTCVPCKYTCVGNLCTHLFCLGSFKRLGSWVLITV